MKIRLNKFLASAGVTSRRNADILIANGQIAVNSKIVTQLGVEIDPEADLIEINGKKLNIAESLIYYALYKPKGVLSTAKDEKGRKSVVDLVPPSPRAYPVGRLDADSEGLMILTNDGELTQKLTHPSFQHEKEYEVTTRIKNNELRIKQNKEEFIISTFIKGMTIDGQLMKADRVAISQIPNTKYYMLNIVLHTGLNRQIRKMCAKIGLEVLQLKRIRIEKLILEPLNLKPGEYKIITKGQII